MKGSYINISKRSKAFKLHKIKLIYHLSSSGEQRLFYTAANGFN